MSSKKSLEKRLIHLFEVKPSIRRPGKMHPQLLNEIGVPKTDAMYRLLDKALDSLEDQGVIQIHRRGKQILGIEAVNHPDDFIIPPELMQRIEAVLAP